MSEQSKVPGQIRIVLQRAGELYDAAPFAAHRVADRVMGWQFARADRRCAADPEWAAIEARRHDGSGRVILFSDERGLGPDEFDRQREIRDRVAPDPWWMPAARAVRGRPVRRARRTVLALVQRARRGWADQDTWSLDGYLCRSTAGALRHLADHAHGWPGTDTYPQPEVWQSALHKAAAAMDAWERHETAVGEDEQAEEERVYAEAQDAFRWVADNLGHLWD